MSKKDKVLVVTVTRNNPVSLFHQYQNISRYKPGYDCDFLIVDNSSDDPRHLQILDNLSKKQNVNVLTAPNGRAEASFNFAWEKNKDYKYYFLMHDDCSPNRDDWIKVFVDRQQSGYAEKLANGYSHLSIGRVGATHQPWRNYTSMLGYSVQCVFLERALHFLYDGNVPEMFKYCDGDRVLLTGECLDARNGIRSLAKFEEIQKENPEIFEKLCEILHENLPYPDEGIPPYPAGQCWNKLTLLLEFLNNVEPLLWGFRTVGLEGDGFLEQIHGYDEPWGHNFVHHYNAPNFLQTISKVMNTDAEEVKKHMKDKIFLIKCDKIIKDYYKDKTNV